jgi:glycosyltransferase involved in cell wall biosynthesis
MNLRGQPLVSVLTPVYNGESYLRECIESVMAQTHSNWEYMIVNNCSTDGTREIAEEYARKDKRIRVDNADVLVGVIANHNRAFRTVSSDSKYCKVVSADDFLFPECITKMVALAEAHPSIGIVGSYQLSGGAEKWYVRNHGLPYHSAFVPGREIGRSQLLGTLDVLGAPTSDLYRSDLVRSTDEFFPNATAEADVSAIYKHLRCTDFGFVHQIVSYERLHDMTMTTVTRDHNAYLPSKVGDLLTYGEFYLTPEEREKRLKELMDEYYAFLAISVVNFRSKKFWDFHRTRLRELGYPLDGIRLGRATSKKLVDLLLNPKLTVERVLRRVNTD